MKEDWSEFKKDILKAVELTIRAEFANYPCKTHELRISTAEKRAEAQSELLDGLQEEVVEAKGFAKAVAAIVAIIQVGLGLAWAYVHMKGGKQ